MLKGNSTAGMVKTIAPLADRADQQKNIAMVGAREIDYQGMVSLKLEEAEAASGMATFPPPSSDRLQFRFITILLFVLSKRRRQQRRLA